ncbi:MAG: hypothetical protein VW684_15235, partial [Betaproteobacteria bacterium]
DAVFYSDPTTNSLTILGRGAYIALPKAVNGDSLTAPEQAPNQITYQVESLNVDRLTLTIESPLDTLWTFRLKRSTTIDCSTQSGGDLCSGDLITQNILGTEASDVIDVGSPNVQFSTLGADINGDGIVDNDPDGDNVHNVSDRFDDDPSEQFDSDYDGVGDNLDVAPFNSSRGADSDGDGVEDTLDAFPDDPLEQLDTDGDGFGNNADPDDDNDQIADLDDAFPLNPDAALAILPFGFDLKDGLPGILVHFPEGALAAPPTILEADTGATFQLEDTETTPGANTFTGSYSSAEGSRAITWSTQSTGELEILTNPSPMLSATSDQRKILVSELTNLIDQKTIDDFIARYGDISIDVLYQDVGVTLALVEEDFLCGCLKIIQKTYKGYFILDDFTRTALQGDVNAGSVFIDDQIPYQEVIRYIDLNQISSEPILDPETNLPFGGNQALEVYLEPTWRGLDKIQSDTVVFERTADLAQTGYLFDRNLPLNWSIEGNDLVIEMDYEGYDDLGNLVSNPATIRYRKLGTYGTGQSLVHMTADYLEQRYTQLTYAVPDKFLGSATEPDLQGLLG